MRGGYFIEGQGGPLWDHDKPFVGRTGGSSWQRDQQVPGHGGSKHPTVSSGQGQDNGSRVGSEIAGT